jgi:hypothetical protein
VTEMATAPRRGSGSGEGASLTASVAALLRVPGGAEVRGKKTPVNVPVNVPLCVRVSRVCPGSPGVFLPVNVNVMCDRKV